MDPNTYDVRRAQQDLKAARPEAFNRANIRDALLGDPVARLDGAQAVGLRFVEDGLDRVEDTARIIHRFLMRQIVQLRVDRHQAAGIDDIVRRIGDVSGHETLGIPNLILEHIIGSAGDDWSANLGNRAFVDDSANGAWCQDIALSAVVLVAADHRTAELTHHAVETGLVDIGKDEVCPFIVKVARQPIADIAEPLDGHGTILDARGAVNHFEARLEAVEDTPRSDG